MRYYHLFILYMIILGSCAGEAEESKSVSIPDREQNSFTEERDLGSECIDDFDCESFYCLIGVDEDFGICVLACEIDSNRCPANFECIDAEEGAFCLESDISTCGNNDLEAGEECDGEAGCTIDCIWEETAGEIAAGEIAAGEVVAGEVVAGEMAPICGNGIVEVNEECDGGDDCTNNCTIMPPPSPVCGNGVRESGEECDGGLGCALDCTSYNGTDGSDTIIGDSRDNRLRGSAGNDTLRGRGGNDELIGGDGDDVLEGGEGNDILKGRAGNDTLRGGEGNDTLEGGSGDDDLRGGQGTDHLYGEGGDDTYTYTINDDVIHIYPNGGGNDRLRCRNGATVMRQSISDGNLRLIMVSGGRIVIHEQAVNGTTIDTIDCPGYDD